MMREVIIVGKEKKAACVEDYSTNQYFSFLVASKLYFREFWNEHGLYSRGISVEGKFPYRNSSFNQNSIFYRKASTKLTEMLK